MADEYRGGRRRSAGAIPWLAAGALVVVAVFGIAGAVLLTGHSSPSSPSHNHKPQALAAASPPAGTTPAQSASPATSPSAHKPAPKSSQSASTAPAPSVTSPKPTANPKPTHKPPKPTPSPSATVQLTASVNVWAHNSGSFGTVTFQVNDTGTAASGQVTVTITLPAGASMSGSGGGGEVSRIAGDWNNWSCQATSTGATCTNAGISAGNQAWGAIDFTVNGSSVCGQPVDLTAVSGSASANAQSSVGC